MRTATKGILCLAAVALVSLGPPQAALAQFQGPGGPCQRDADCHACGWVCSIPRGNICIPSREGDPGSCAVDADCACAGQSCDAGHCDPAPHLQCVCNSDCPCGQICDQLLWTCHAQPEQGTACISDEQDSTGACGCGFHCNSSVGPCYSMHGGPAVVPECLSDIDCDVCETGMICVSPPPDSGLPVLDRQCRPGFAGGWCGTPATVQACDAGVSDGGEVDGGLTADGGEPPRGCGCSGSRNAGGGSTSGAFAFFFALLAWRMAGRTRSRERSIR